ANRSGLSGEYQEGRLKCMIRIVNTTKCALTDAQHHWAMTLRNNAKRRFVVRFDKALKQIGIAGSAQGLNREQLHDGSQRSVGGLLNHGFQVGGLNDLSQGR